MRIARLCEALGVTRSAYYAWDKRPEGKREAKRRELTERVWEEFFTNHQIPGATKIARALSNPEEPVSRKAVASIRKENGWRSKVVKKYKATTNSNHSLPVVV